RIGTISPVCQCHRAALFPRFPTSLSALLLFLRRTPTLRLQRRYLLLKVSNLPREDRYVLHQLQNLLPLLNARHACSYAIDPPIRTNLSRLTGKCVFGSLKLIAAPMKAEAPCDAQSC